MKRIRAIHPSAALFVGILIAFTLPFGYSASACGPSTGQYTGVDLLRAHVKSDGSQRSVEYAANVASAGRTFAWLLFLTAAIGLALALFARGRLWATSCVIAAVLAVVLAFEVEISETYVGWELAFFIPAGGAFLKLAIATARYLWRELPAWFAPAVTTPDEPAVR